MVYHHRKIRNKERVASRGKKQRYAVFRAELNRRWERIFEKLVYQVCDDNKLNVVEHIVEDERIPWEHTWNKLKDDGYFLQTRSIKDIQTAVEATPEWINPGSV